MSNLDLALTQARNGWPVFPCQEDKRPKKGLMDWETAATQDEEQIQSWWRENPEFLVAVPPGRRGKAVIDIDRHDGKDDGFASLEEAGITLPLAFNAPSVSRKGQHWWFAKEVGSVNGIYPGVDRKAQGGYIVTAYILPPPDQIATPLPEILSAGVQASNVERRDLSNFQLNDWLRTVGAGDPDDDMWQVVESFLPKGNQQMSVKIAKVVSLGAQGHPGATVALDRMKDIWLSVTHYSGDPDEEFQVNVRSAIEKFGEPVSQEEDPVEALKKALTPDVTINLNELRESLRLYCTSLMPDWESHKYIEDRFVRCVCILQYVRSVADAEIWREKTKVIMSQVIFNTP